MELQDPFDFGFWIICVIQCSSVQFSAVQYNYMQNSTIIKSNSVFFSEWQWSAIHWPAEFILVNKCIANTQANPWIKKNKSNKEFFKQIKIYKK